MHILPPRHLPPLDPDFVPAVLWNRAYQERVAADPGSHDLHLALARKDGTTFHHQLRILPHGGEHVALNRRYIERMVKFLLWMKGGSRLFVAGDDAVAAVLSGIYCEDGARAFDWDIVGSGIFDEPISVTRCTLAELPAAAESSVALGRNLDGCRIGFDLTWRNSLRFRVLLFSDDGETTQPDNCYDLVCQRRFVYLRKRWMTRASGGTRIVGQANIAELAEREKVRFDFYIDRGDGTIALYIDGSKAHVWSDQDPKIGSFGKWLHFISEDFYPVQVSRIRVSPWKGDLPENVDVADEQEQEDEDGQVIRLQNGDIVIGEVGKIENGVLDIKTKYCDMKIPVDRMRTVDLSTGDYEEPIRKNGDVRAWLREGGRITFRLDSFTKDTLKGYSQTFGDAEFMLNAFSRLEFNIYDEELESMRGSSNW